MSATTEFVGRATGWVLLLVWADATFGVPGWCLAGGAFLLWRHGPPPRPGS